MNRDLPIGIFDSGVGGLTVYRALHGRLPDEHFVYLGDTARVPYGTNLWGRSSVTRSRIRFSWNHTASSCWSLPAIRRRRSRCRQSAAPSALK
ncbi:MAG TPA: hypothetical protein VF766_01160 [Pyrinomonadaceae bacterium]